jgi:hypothetical protein
MLLILRVVLPTQHEIVHFLTYDNQIQLFLQLPQRHLLRREILLQNSLFALLGYREDVVVLKRINKGFRIAYVHQKFELIFSRYTMPAYKIDISGDDMIGKIKTGIEDVRKGKIKPIMVDLRKDSSLAAISKEPVDHFNALLFAWITNIILEQLTKIYLNQKAYDEHISKFGNPFS